MAVLPENKEFSVTTPLLLHDECCDNREEGTTTFFRTCFNGLNALSGAGLLSVPYAVSTGGWLSLILLFSISSITFFTSLLIKWCMDFDSQIRTYPDVGEHAFGHIGRDIISIFMYLELYLVSTGFLILEGDNLYNMFPNIGFEYSWIVLSGRECFVIIVSLIILPTLWLRDLSMLSYVSATGVLASSIIIGSVIWVGVVDGVGFQEKGTILNLSGIPTTFSLYIFCYCAHPVFPTLYTSMRDKNQFKKVLFLCFVLCTTGYITMAILGYRMYGENVKSQVTLNLPIEKISSKIAIYTALVSPITKYALMVAPIISAVENRFTYKMRHANIMISTLVLITSVIVALAIPFFGDLMSLVGAFLSVMASIVLPCICYLKISETYKRWSYELLLIIGIIFMGIFIMITGTYTSLSQIIEHL